LSLAAQLTDCRRYVSVHSWSIGAEHQDVMSGKRNDRPSYQDLLADVRRMRREGQNVVVVVKWLNRLGRRVSERVRCWDELAASGVQIHSAAEGGLQTKLVADILAAVAEEESRQIGDRVASTWRHVTAQGWAQVGRVRWGYQLREATAVERAAGSPKSMLDIDPEAAPFVAEAFQKVAAGETERCVARWVATLPDRARGGRRLTWSSVRAVMRRPGYAGRPVNGVDDVLERSPAKWPALVADDVWQRVQNRLDGHQDMAHQASGQFLLTGVLRCPVCGGPMRGDRQRYRCGSADPGKLCSQTADAKRVERQVLAEIGAVVDVIASNPRVQAALRRAWQARHKPKAPIMANTFGNSRRRLPALTSASSAGLRCSSTGRSTRPHTTTS
jgi:site-specific DNA recombinase